MSGNQETFPSFPTRRPTLPSFPPLDRSLDRTMDRPASISSTTLGKIRAGAVPHVSWVALVFGVIGICGFVYLFSYLQILRSKVDHTVFELNVYRSEIRQLIIEENPARIHNLDLRLEKLNNTLSTILTSSELLDEAPKSPPPKKGAKGGT